MTTRLPWYRLAGLTLFALAFGIGANSLEPAVLGQRFLELAPEHKNTALGLTTAAGLLVAALVQPVVGGFSDRTAGRLGRRIPYFIAGCALASAALFGVVLAPTLLLVALGVLAFQFGSNTAQGPWQALIPDQVPVSQRGAAAGLKSLFEVLGFVVGRALSGYLVAEGRALAAVASAAAALFAALLLTGLASRRDIAPAGDRPAPPSPPLPSAGQAPGLRAAVDLQPLLRLVVRPAGAFLVWAAGPQHLHAVLPDGRGGDGICPGLPLRRPAFSGARRRRVGPSLPAGRLADRLGRRPLVLAAGLLAAAGTGVILVARSPALLFLAGAMLGVAVGAWQSANWALITDIVPAAHAARYLGLANIATAGGSLVGRSAGALLVDPLNRLAGSQSVGYLALYSLTLVMFLLSAWAVRRIPSSQREAAIGV